MFLITLILSWDESQGSIISNQLLFYTLDEAATVLFFSLACVLALFWAEVYYISIDKLKVLKYFVRPLIYCINIFALLVVCICSYLESIASPNKEMHSYPQYSLMLGVVYTVGAFLFAIFGYRSARELNQVPIEVATRKERMRVLTTLSLIFVSTLVTRAVILILLSFRRDQSRHISRIELFIMLVFYVVLELVPLLFALDFYRVEQSDTIDFFESADPWEIAHLQDQDVGITVEEGKHERYLGYQQSATISRVNRSSDEVVASIIDRISLSPKP